MTSLYRAEWPREKIPVEVVFCADWAGGYTVTNSTLITISSVDPGCQGYAALETLFPEASHALVDTLAQQLASPLRAAGKSPTFPRTHRIIFYTAGAVTSEALAQNGIEDHVPYAEKNGRYARVPHGAHYRDIFERDGQPYIDGKLSLDDARMRTARDF
jgi:hypothetical protein